jgi:hypothetical protein
MKRNWTAVMLILALIILCPGCQAVPEQHKGAAVGAGAGAAAGAVAGAALGRSTKAAVIGGLAGALLGGVIGHYAYDRQRTREETAQVYNYQPEQGTVLTIEDASLSSEQVRPGDVLEIKMTYAVLTPTPEKQVAITEVREITHGGELVGRPEVRVERADGTYSSTVPLRLPSNAKTGKYQVRVSIEAENLKDTRELSFTVL